jgi:hypothetical protein
VRNNLIVTNGAGPVPTAVEAALAKTEPSSTPLTDAVLAGHLPPGGRASIRNHRQFIDWMQLDNELPEGLAEAWPELRKQGVEKFGIELPELPPAGAMYQDLFAICSQSELLALREIQAEFDAVMKRMTEYSTANVSGRLNVMRDEHAAAIREGRDAGLLPTREMVSRDSLARQQAMNNMLVTLTHEKVVPLAQPILERFATMAVNFLRKTELRDREACTIMGIGFEPSAEFRAAALIVQAYQPAARLPKSPSMWLSPRLMLEGVVEI